MARGLIRVIRDRRGAAGAEFALIIVVFAGLLLGIIDFGRALWEYNEAEKACQVGARFAVVNNMVATDLYAWDGVADGGLVAGQPIPVAAISPNPVTCDDSACSGWGYDAAAYDAIYDAMAAHYPRLGSSSSPNATAVVEVTYEHIGRGFASNPLGPDVWPLATVSIRGVLFEFSTPLIGNIVPFEFPKCSASLIGEDYQTCSDGVSQPPCT
jgi:Flp pilus assembly protein TadG